MSRRRTLAVAVAVLLAVSAAVLVAGSERDRSTAPPSTAPPATPPGAWDPRVAPLAEFAAEARGLAFKHPVPVEFLDDAEFVARVTSDGASMTDEEHTRLEEQSVLVRALGVVPGDFDWLAAENLLAGEGILAYYDAEDEYIGVRGVDMTVARRVTLVHELVHVLQDQHFDLTRNYESDARNFALAAVAEGDAIRIERAYLATLSAEELDAYEEEMYGDGADAGLAPLEPVPDWLSAYAAAPYVLGEPFVAALTAAGGPPAVDAALRDPPVTEAHVVHVTRYLAGEPARPVAAPRLHPGEQKIQRSDLGGLGLALLLGERLPATEAVEAADHWGGDAYVTFRSGGAVCAKVAWVGDTAAGADRLAVALERWARAGPGAGASVRRHGDQVLLRSCEPGAGDATEGSGGGSGAEGVMRMLASRATVVAATLDRGAAPDVAACVGDEALRRFDVEDLAPRDLPGGFDEWMAPVGDSCRVRLAAAGGN